MSAQKWPSCGMADCNARATHVDQDGVGFCGQHTLCGLTPTRPALSIEYFDRWWAAANGDPRYNDLPYGVHPTELLTDLEPGQPAPPMAGDGNA